jgi:hypothetical protein
MIAWTEVLPFHFRPLTKELRVVEKASMDIEHEDFHGVRVGDEAWHRGDIRGGRRGRAILRGLSPRQKVGRRGKDNRAGRWGWTLDDCPSPSDLLSAQGWVP